MTADPLAAALDRVREGGLIAYPTETVWGLGADARSDAAFARLRDWKGRGSEAPVSILVPGAESLCGLGFEPRRDVERLTEAFWPGPLTLVMPCRGRFARGLARDDGAVGVRCSANPLAAALARRLAEVGVGPVTSTSLNRSGEPPARDLGEARALCEAGADGPLLLYAEGAEAGGGAPSTVLDLTAERPRVLRWGALPERVVAPVLEEIAAA